MTDSPYPKCDLLCILLIPSRGRPTLCRRMILSAIETSNGENFRALVRIDDDDPDREAYFRELSGDGISERVSIFVGSRQIGWGSGTIFCSEMAETEPQAKWAWFLNDDMMILGKGWDSQLAKIPTDGFIVQPEYHRLNASVYERDERSCAPITPNLCWKKFGYNHPPTPVDALLPQLLEQKGWTTRFLEGITIFHDRNVNRK